MFGDRKICLARELTKMHEEFIRGTISEVLEVASSLKGEMVIVVEGHQKEEEIFDMDICIDRVNAYIDGGMRTKEAIGMVAKEMGCKKNELYEAYHKR